MHRGVCIGGPFAGQTIVTRSEIGFLAVDRPGFAAWVYYVDPAGRFVLDTSDDPSRLDEDGTRALDLARAEATAADKGLDIIAVPGDGTDEEDPEPGPIEPIPAELFDDAAEEVGH